MEQCRDFRYGGEWQPATECFSTDCGIKGGRRMSQKWGSLLSPLLCLLGQLPLVTFPLGFLNGTKQWNLWGQKPVSFYVEQHAPAAVSGHCQLAYPGRSFIRRRRQGPGGCHHCCYTWGCCSVSRVRRGSEEARGQGANRRDGAHRGEVAAKRTLLLFFKWPGRPGMCQRWVRTEDEMHRGLGDPS